MAAATLLRYSKNDRDIGGPSMTDNTANQHGDLAKLLKGVLRRMPGPVALITTRDIITGEPAGLAASAVIPVSMAPPSMLVCVNRAASAHAVIEASGRFCITLVGEEQTMLVEAFSKPEHRSRRFSGGGWSERHGLAYLPAAPASLFCHVRTTLLFGTHEAFVGEVFDVAGDDAVDPIGWVKGGFVQFTPVDECGGTPDDTGAERYIDNRGAYP